MKRRAESESKGEEGLPVGEARIAVDAGRVMGDVSPLLTGCNMSYYYDRDDIWADGEIARRLKEVSCGVLRFPGGEETSFYHWEAPGCPIYRDAWDTDPKSCYCADPGAYIANCMDTAKFVNWCRQIGAEPLVGVNIESGARFNRIQDSLEEAVRWVAHCRERGYAVNYWYMDNESFFNERTEQSGGNYKELSVEEYAEHVSVFATAMREVDPSLKVIANWDANLGTPRVQDQLAKLLRAAGEHIDIMDFHYYWNHGKASWELWLSQNPMRNEAWDREGWYEGRPYVDEIRDFQLLARGLGHDIELACLEWNIAPSPAEHSPFQHALMQSEMLGQFVEGGAQMACIWPLTHPVNDGHFRSLLQKTWQPTPLLQVFKLYSRALGQRLVKSHTSRPQVRPVSVVSGDGRTLLVYLLNKSGEGQTVEAQVEVSGFECASAQGVALTAPSLAAEEGEMVDLAVTSRPSAGSVECLLPPHSLALITVSARG